MFSICSPFPESRNNRLKREKENLTDTKNLETKTPIIQTFTHVGDGKTGTYVTPENANLLHIQLWGGGGGGGGCTTTTAPNDFAVGAGGGGGGYAEAFVQPPFEEKYDYYIAVGGLGGYGITGASAETSWFGMLDGQPQVIATGGQGGGTMTGTRIADVTNSFVAPGGLGGKGDGPLSQLKCEGSAGGNSIRNAFDAREYISAGEGGAAPYASGFTRQLGDTIEENTSTSVSGVPGCPSGGGGSGSFIIRKENSRESGGSGSEGVLYITVSNF